MTPTVHLRTHWTFAGCALSTAMVAGCSAGVVEGGRAHAADANFVDAQAMDTLSVAPDVTTDSTAPAVDAMTTPDVASDAGTDMPGPMDVPMSEADVAPDLPAPIDVPASAPDVPSDFPTPTAVDLHSCTVFNNPPNLADWPVTTEITEVDFQYMGSDGVHVEFSLRDGPGSWPDVTPPGWDGTLEYTLGLVEFIGGQCYASAAVQFWRGLPASGGNLAEDVPSMGQCTSFGYGSTCQVAENWYYDGRWGALAGYQPATGEIIGVFVVAGNLRGVTDGSQSPVMERSNVVLVPMPPLAGSTNTF